jgi:hypothetical protein
LKLLDYYYHLAMRHGRWGYGAPLKSQATDRCRARLTFYFRKA